LGTGNLLRPWRQKVLTYGCDTNIENFRFADKFVHGAFENLPLWPHSSPELIICNPPFNQGGGKKLYPEVFLRKIIDLFGPDIPVVLFVPMGFRLNQRLRSARWQWLRDAGPALTGIISLPLDLFPGVEFHNEIVVFNFPVSPVHQFLPEKVVQELRSGR